MATFELVFGNSIDELAIRKREFDVAYDMRMKAARSGGIIAAIKARCFPLYYAP